jgi:DNA-binding SARP family transcriptional activator
VSVHFGLLGPFTVSLDGHSPIALGPVKQRVLLAALLLRPNDAVSLAELATALWAGEPPRSATANLRTYVRGLRHCLRAGHEPTARLLAIPGGYLLRVTPGERDVDEFDQAAARGRAALAAGDPARGERELARAVALWRGAPLGGLPLSPLLAAQASRLQERLLLAEEDHAAAMLAVGAEAEAVQRLRALVERHALRQRAWEHLMVGLYRLGDHAGALAAYQQARQLLAEQTGLDPAPRRSRLHDDILHHRVHLAGHS